MESSIICGNSMTKVNDMDFLELQTEVPELPQLLEDLNKNTTETVGF